MANGEAVFQQHGVAYNVTLEAGGWEVIKKYVEMGLGISIVTDICLTGKMRGSCESRLIGFLPTGPTVSYCAGRSIFSHRRASSLG